MSEVDVRFLTWGYTTASSLALARTDQRVRDWWRRWPRRLAHKATPLSRGVSGDSLMTRRLRAGARGDPRIKEDINVLGVRLLLGLEHTLELSDSEEAHRLFEL